VERSSVGNHFSHLSPYKWVVIQTDDWIHRFSGIVDNWYGEGESERRGVSTVSKVLRILEGMRESTFDEIFNCSYVEQAQVNSTL